MTFKVTFKIRWSKGGDPIANGILVYECDNARGRQMWPDRLDDKGVAETTWHDSWSGDEVKVYCHTDGINSGTPRYIHTVTLKRGETFTLWP